MLNPRINIQAFQELLSLLTKHRLLTVTLARREFTDRYAGQVFGIFWAIGHPLTLMLVYIFIFNIVFKVRFPDSSLFNLDYTVYMLSGLIPWLALTESMAKGATSITSNANLVKQIIFPIEVLPVKGVLATIVTQTFFLVFLTIYTLIRNQTIYWTHLLIPVLILLSTLLMVGLSFILAAIGAYFRDIKDLVQVFSIVGVYLMPTFYLPEAIPGMFKWILNINPISYLIWCYQDVLYFGKFLHPVAWIIFPTLSIVTFIFGYRIFRKFRMILGNIL